MRRISIIVVFLFVVTIFASCKKSIVDNPNNSEYEPDLQQFEAVWNGLNTAYVFWPVDSTDWDAVYEKYHPIFAEMDGKSNSEWKDAWNGVFSTLIDHHMSFSLYRPGNNTFCGGEPGRKEVKSRYYYHEPLEPGKRRRMLKNYLDAGILTDSYNVNYDSNFENCYSGVLDNCVAYIYISSFHNLNLDSIEAFRHFKQLVAKNSVKAAIIDVRDNGGGDVNNLEKELACFTSDCILVGFQQTKTGLDRFDLSPKLPVYAYPDQTLYCQSKDIPVIILANVNSASMAESTAMVFKSLPQGYVVGERTYGAIGPVTKDFEHLYSGAFGYCANGHGHRIVTPDYLLYGPDSVCYEGRGIEPDLECLFNKSAWDSGTDNQLECAVEFAKKKIEENGN